MGLSDELRAAAAEPTLIPPSAERIVVGAADPVGGSGQSYARRGGKKRRIEGAGPVFLFILLCAGFIPSVFIEFDASQLLKIIQAAIVAIAQPSPLFAAGDQGGTEPTRHQACCPAGFQVADSAAAVFDGSLAPRAPASDAKGRRRRPFRRRRTRGGPSPRAPPSSSPPSPNP
jgi:hypothetical protein